MASSTYSNKFQIQSLSLQSNKSLLEQINEYISHIQITSLLNDIEYVRKDSHYYQIEKRLFELHDPKGFLYKLAGCDVFANIHLVPEQLLALMSQDKVFKTLMFNHFRENYNKAIVLALEIVYLFFENSLRQGKCTNCIMPEK